MQRPDVGRPGDLADASRAAEPIAVPGGEADDLTEAEGDDGEVVASKPQGGCAEQKTGEHREADRERQRGPEAEMRVSRREHADRVRADRVEGDITEVEQARVPHDDVEAESPR